MYLEITGREIDNKTPFLDSSTETQNLNKKLTFFSLYPPMDDDVSTLFVANGHYDHLNWHDDPNDLLGL